MHAISNFKILYFKRASHLNYKKNWVTHGFIGMSNCIDLWFDIFGIDEPDKAWEKLEFVFSKLNEIQGHQLENELISLNPSDFSCI